MRSKAYLVGTLLLFVPPLLAQSCRNATIAANALLENAKDRIGVGEPEMAVTLINEAQALLGVCHPDETVLISQRAASPIAIPEITATATALSPGGFDIQPPEVDLTQAIVFIAFAHTSIDSGPLDIYLGSSQTPVVAKLTYGEATHLVPLNAGMRQFTVRPAGSGPDQDSLARVEWNYAANSSWIVTAAGLLSEFAFIVEPISIVRNDYHERSRVRVVNLVRDMRLSVRSDSGGEFGNGLGWIGIKDTMVDPGMYELHVRTADGKTTNEAIAFDFLVERTYTLYLIGQPERGHPISVLPIVTPQETTRVRFVSARDGSVDVHYRPSNERIVEAIAGGETSPYIPLASGAVTFIVTEVTLSH
jgi:hypothetical protein